MYPINLGPQIKQYLIVITANMCIVCGGLGIAWPSPILVKLRNATDDMQVGPISEKEGSWIVSMSSLSSTLFILISGYLVDRIGRKYCIILSYVPRLAQCLILTFASEVWMLMLGRAISGVADALAFTVIPMYASEIASPLIRGSLGTVLQTCSCLGILTVLSMGPFVSYFTLNLFILVVSIVTLVPMFFLPDSPYFLHARGRTDEALKILTDLRGSETLARNEIKEYSFGEKIEKVDKLQLFKDRSFVKALTMVIVIGIGTQLTGFNAVTFYLQTILESTGTSVRAEIASVIIGIIQLIASFCTALVTDRFGRKPILMFTLTGMSIGMIGLGTFFQLKATNEDITGLLNYLPLTSLILVVFCFSSGIGSLMWSVSAELFDGSARAVGMSTFIILSTSFTFITTKYFPAFIYYAGEPIAYWTFAICCILFCLFFVFCVPETKGKSFIEIQEALCAKRNEKKVTNDITEKA